MKKLFTLACLALGCTLITQSIMKAHQDEHTDTRQAFSKTKKELLVRTLRRHIDTHGADVNTIQIEARIDRAQDFPKDDEHWLEFLTNIIAICQAAAGEEWIEGSEINIHEPSKTTDILFTFGSDELGMAGEFKVRLGSAACCGECCYPICECSVDDEGRCPCRQAHAFIDNCTKNKK